MSIFNEQSLQSMSHQTEVEQTPKTISEGNLLNHMFSVAPPCKQNTFTQSTDMYQFPSKYSEVRHILSNQPEHNFKSQKDHDGTEFPVNPFDHKHMPLKPQSSVPSMAGQHAHVGSKVWNVPIGLSRQNSSSDPQIHMCVGQQTSFSTSKASVPPVSGHMVHSLSGPANPQHVPMYSYKQLGAQPRLHSSNEYGIPGVSYQNELYQSPYVGSRSEPQYSQNIHEQQQHYSFSMKHLPPSLGLNQISPMNSRVGDVSPYQTAMQLPSGPGLPNYQQEQQLLPSQYPQVPQFLGSPNNSEGLQQMQQTLLSPTASYTGQTTDFPQSFHQPPPNFPPPSPMMQHCSNQPPPQMYYPIQSPVPQGSIGYATPISYSHMGPSVPQLLAEDIPIPPNDPRHSLYSHLSAVFQETVVRKVMNRYPHLIKFDDIVNKIWEYVNSGQL